MPLTKEQTNAALEQVGKKLLLSLLKRISWDTCEIHRGGIFCEGLIFDAVEQAAKELKDLGVGWEEYT